MEIRKLIIHQCGRRKKKKKSNKIAQINSHYSLSWPEYSSDRPQFNPDQCQWISIMGYLQYIWDCTSDKNGASFCTHENSCAVINVGNLRHHQWIITTNLYIVESCIKFDYEKHFDPIRLNLALDDTKNHLKEKLISVVTYITRYKDSNKNQ